MNNSFSLPPISRQPVYGLQVAQNTQMPDFKMRLKRSGLGGVLDLNWHIHFSYFRSIP